MPSVEQLLRTDRDNATERMAALPGLTVTNNVHTSCPCPVCGKRFVVVTESGGRFLLYRNFCTHPKAAIVAALGWDASLFDLTEPPPPVPEPVPSRVTAGNTVLQLDRPDPDHTLHNEAAAEGQIGPPKCLATVTYTPLSFTVDGLMLANDLTAFVGEGDSGKSTLLYHLAAAIASGQPAFNHFAVPTPGPVLIVSGGEDDAALMVNRITAMCRAHGWSDVLPRVHVFDEGMNLDNPACEARITTALQDLRAVAFFCDPLADLLGDQAEENSNTDARRITRALRRITVASRTACGLVHHASKPSEGKSKGHRVRGASAWLNATRLTWWVEKSDGGMVLEPVKANRLARRLPHRILRTVATEADGLTWRACHLSLDTTAVVTSDDTMVLLRLLRDAQAAPNTRTTRTMLAAAGMGTERANVAMGAVETRGWATTTPGAGQAKLWALSEAGRARLLLSEGA